MAIILGVFFFLLGLGVGSFVNVVSFRYHTGRSIVGGRSACFSCAEAIPWYDLLPVISYVVLAGRCRSCGSALSLQYPAVELATGLLFLGIYLKFSLLFGANSTYSILHTLYYALIVSVLMIILIYDLRHKIIPNAFVYTLIIFSLLPIFTLKIWSLVIGHWDLIRWTNNSLRISELLEIEILLAGIGMSLPIAALWFFSRGRAMGLGDAKLALALGFLLGPTGALSAFLLSFWVGALVGVLLLTAPRLFEARAQFTMRSEIPFAPFLILGFLLVFFFNIDVRALFI